MAKYGGYCKKLRAGKRRTYFFDVRSTKQGDFFLTITESKKKFEGDGYDNTRFFCIKDFKKFLEALNESVEYIKTELMPDYDYESERPAKTNNNVAAESMADEQPVASSAEVSTNDASTTSASSISDDEEIDWN